jgi:hypothetical protein
MLEKLIGWITKKGITNIQELDGLAKNKISKYI